MKIKQLVLRTSLLWLLITSTSCNYSKRLSSNFFVLPLDKKFFPVKYVDTANPYEGYYVLKTNDTVSFRVFHRVNTLSEECPELEHVSTLIRTEIEGKDTVHVWSGRTNYDRDVNRKQNVYYRYSKELNADYKLTVPIDSNRTGMFGIYTDSYYVFSNRLPPLQMNVFIKHPQKGSYKALYKSFFKLSFIPFDEKHLKVPSAIIY